MKHAIVLAIGRANRGQRERGDSHRKRVEQEPRCVKIEAKEFAFAEKSSDEAQKYPVDFD